MPIKVLVISNYRDYHSSRPEASIFKGLAEKGFKIYVMTYKDSKHFEDFENLGMKVIDFHIGKKFDRKEINKIREVIQQEEIDIMHLFNNRAIVNGIIAAKGLPVQVVLYRGYAGNIHWYDPTAYLKFLNPRVDMITCNSKGVEEVIQQQLFFDKRKTVTISKGHDVSWYEGYEPYDIRKELGIPKDSFLFINVANNRRMKGIPYLLKAFNRIPDGHPIHLLLVGRDMDNRHNLKIINEGNKKTRVHILGFRESVLNIVVGCDAFVLSSIKGESNTRSVVEAMSLEVPVILTNIPGNRDLLIHEESGLIVPSKDPETLSNAMMRLYSDQHLHKKLSINAKQRIATYLDYRKTVEKMKALYERLIKKSNN